LRRSERKERETESHDAPRLNGFRSVEDLCTRAGHHPDLRKLGRVGSDDDEGRAELVEVREDGPPWEKREGRC